MLMLSLATCMLTDAPPNVERASAVKPVAFVLSSRFGRRVDPLRGGIRVHRGIDVLGRAGAPVFAAAAGQVRFAGERGSYGRLVEIEHVDGSRSRYAHLSASLVRAGDVVRVGDRIGLIGSTGRSTGPHLHFELHVAGAAVDPLPCFAGGSLSVAGSHYEPTKIHRSAFAEARAKLSDAEAEAGLPNGPTAAVRLP